MSRVDESFLSLLRCPRTGAALRLAGAGELADHNQRVRDGRLSNSAGEPLEREMEGALLSECGRWLYPVFDGIPILLAEEAVPLADTCA